ncbi:MAG: ATP-binding protein [Candidatus Heimdallarchaeota archaeon]
MIAQSRAFGLGIAISTQSPSKLPREIMINCNTKIIHKIIDGHDISLLQHSMRLTNGQANMLPALKIGEALVMSRVG